VTDKNDNQNSHASARFLKESDEQSFGSADILPAGDQEDQPPLVAPQKSLKNLNNYPFRPM
jgi:hypothetical protein